jgi:hypothetical protein
MTPRALLTQLHAAGVTLWNDAETLRYRAPKGVMTPGLVEGMRQHKEALLTLLERHEERAAILEYCAGLPRADAERQAWAIVLGGATVQQVEREETA